MQPKCNDTGMPIPHQPSANESQVGGTHWLIMPIQCWDFIARNGLGYFEGNVVKYVSRWRAKGGVDDLKKARHYLDKLIEMAEAKAIH